MLVNVYTGRGICGGNLLTTSAIEHCFVEVRRRTRPVVRSVHPASVDRDHLRHLPPLHRRPAKLNPGLFAQAASHQRSALSSLTIWPNRVLYSYLPADRLGSLHQTVSLAVRPGGLALSPSKSFEPRPGLRRFGTRLRRGKSMSRKDDVRDRRGLGVENGRAAIPYVLGIRVEARGSNNGPNGLQKKPVLN